MGVLITPMALAHSLHPIKSRSRNKRETCVLDYVFPPDDLDTGPCTPFIIYTPHIIAAFLLIKINSFWETYIPRVGMAILVCRMIWYCLVSGVLSVLCSSIVCGYSYCDILHLSVAPPNRIANRTGFWVYVLMLDVIRRSCYYFQDGILFHHDFHHDGCDYNWDFYGHWLPFDPHFRLPLHN